MIKMKDQKLILEKIKQKADGLGLEFNPKIFVVNFLTKRGVNIISYLCMNPRYDKFGKNAKQRANNLTKFLHSEEIKEGTKGTVVNKRSILQYESLLKDTEHMRMFEKLTKGFKFNTAGYGPLVERSGFDSVQKNEIIFHEWAHTLLSYNKLGFYDTGEDRWKYNEGLAIFVEYYLGSYHDRDVGSLKDRLEWTKKYGNKVPFDKFLKYADIFIKLAEGPATPNKRRDALFKFFKEFKAPDKAKRWPS
ncbi:MAG TPA: hypothetical protein VL944_02705 [Candidatus Acidoferrum sp.]|nr:hypothetical protein [Candidatus Acidoferrum sp.]